MKRPRAIFCGVLLLVACGSPQASTTAPEAVTEPPPEPTTAPVPTAGQIVDGFWMAEGAPPPLACTADADCGYGGVVDDTGCCWSFRDMNAVAQSRAYTTWLAAHRARLCAEVACPSPPVPSEPPACLFEVRCDMSSGAGLCVDACMAMAPTTS